MRHALTAVRWRTIALAAAFAAILPSPVAPGAAQQNREAMKDLMEGLRVGPPPAASLGHYAGPVRIALGSVADDGYSETADFLGVGPNATFRVTLATSRLESVAEAVAQLLGSTGLAEADPELADYRLDVTIRRDRFFYDGDRLRSEVILYFDFLQDDVTAGSILAYGNAEATYAAPQFTGLKKVRPVYEGAFHDALYKLVESRTFQRLVGEGWMPGTRAELADSDATDAEVGRIDKTTYYLPTEPSPEEEALAALLAPRNYHRLILQDFEILDKEFRKKAEKIERKASGTHEGTKAGRATKKTLKVMFYPHRKIAKAIVGKGGNNKSANAEGTPELDGADQPPEQIAEPQTKKEIKRARAARVGTSAEDAMAAGVRPTALACECLPGLIREHVRAFYPGAFAEIVRRRAWEPAEGLVVTGEIHRFNMGSTNTRLEVDIFLQDGLTGETLHTIPLEMGGGMNWKTGTLSMFMMGAAGAAGSSLLPVYYQVAPAMRDMEDDVARAVAHTIVASSHPTYEGPPELEIAFDEWSREPVISSSDPHKPREDPIETDPVTATDDAIGD